MNAAASSCRTWMKRIFSRCTRSASNTPLMPSPGSPKATETPQSRSRSTSSSEVVFAIVALLPGRLAKARTRGHTSSGGPPEREPRHADSRQRRGPEPCEIRPMQTVEHDRRVVLLRYVARRSGGSVVQRHLQDLREVERAPVRRLRDLLLAAEAVGDDQRVRCR